MSKLNVLNKSYSYTDITGQPNVKKLPYSLRVLLENVIRQENGRTITSAHKDAILKFAEGQTGEESTFLPSRVILQDFTGVPAIVDLAAMRDEMKRRGFDATLINPEIPVDLVIDHSLQVDYSGTSESLYQNAKREFERNQERFEFLKWAEQSFDNFRVVPPATGIIHQVNIEYLSPVVVEKDGHLYPDSVFGTDSHTTMVNALGVLGWGVGGIEAEAVMLGEPSGMVVPEIIGVEFVGELSGFATATDVALTVTHVLRKENVVGKFVEFTGVGLSSLNLSDRAVISNMAPEYGATCGFFPIDEATIDYLRETNRSEEQVALVEAYAKANGLFYDETEAPTYTKKITINLSQVQPQLSGPSRPQDTVSLADLGANFENFASGLKSLSDADGKVAVAAITSCTNTSNPALMMMAGLLAKKATEVGLTVPGWVKTSLAPGSKVVTAYLEAAGLLPHLEQLGFHVIGYGCATCIGNTGPLLDQVEQEIAEVGTVVTSVLSGNRNFEGRIHPLIKANYLASPPLVIAYALAGNVRVNLNEDALGQDADGNPVYLKDILPTREEVAALVAAHVNRDVFAKTYEDVFAGNSQWNQIETTSSDVYAWNPNSTYIENPPYFAESAAEASFSNLKVLAKFGDSVTTDHISPAGSIPESSPAGQYLLSKGVGVSDFNSYGARRGNDKVMTRGTFANIRIKNQLAPGTEGGYTTYLGEAKKGEVMAIYDATQAYKAEGKGLIVLAGSDYGMGSSRDWAAKGTALLGVKAVIAKSFERIHRSNLVMMGVVPLEFVDGQCADSLGLVGAEDFTIHLPESPQVGQLVTVDAGEKSFEVKLRFDSQGDLDYFAAGGIMPYVLDKKAGN